MLCCAAGVFPRGPGQVMKLRVQIKQYVAGQLAACTEPGPAHPEKLFRVRQEWGSALRATVASAEAGSDILIMMHFNTYKVLC